MGKTIARCPVCGKVTALCQPYGEGTIFKTRRHYVNGRLCKGWFEECELIDVDIEGDPRKTKPAPAGGEARP